jgi:hypothetical protein
MRRFILLPTLCALVPRAHGAWLTGAAGTAGTARHGTRAALLCATPRMLAPSEELKDELFELLDEVADRGMSAPQDLKDDIFEVVGELEASVAPVADEDWERSPTHLEGRWQLLYSSSKTFANNQGLSGYARDIAGVETPELYMSVSTQFQRLVYEEPLALQSGSLAAIAGKFANADSVRVECVWNRKGDTLAIEAQNVVVGGNSWTPADRQDKAVRTLSAAQPVFLDDELLVLRAQPPYIVWIFERADAA